MNAAVRPMARQERNVAAGVVRPGAERVAMAGDGGPSGAHAAIKPECKAPDAPTDGLVRRRNGEEGRGRPRERRLVLYHATSAGSGAAIQLEPRFNRREGERYDCFFLEMASQKTAAVAQGGSRAPATFDWEHKLTVKLDFPDICEILSVIEGKSELAGNGRNGIYHDSGQACTVITFQRADEKSGYLVGLSRKDKVGNPPVRVHMTLSESEAIGLRCILQTGLFFMLFHASLPLGSREG